MLQPVQTGRQKTLEDVCGGKKGNCVDVLPFFFFKMGKIG